MSKHEDCFGAPVSCEGDALAGVDDFVDGFVRYQTKATRVLNVADALPDVALPNIYAGMLWMFLERPEAPDKAAPYIQRALACKTLNDRERGLRELLISWQAYDLTKASGIADQLLDTYPQDLSTLKLAQYHLFNAGDSQGMLRVAYKCRNTLTEQAPLHSMLAFAHEQCHQIENAERAANRALTLDANEPWAHHALAHVHLSRGSIAQGKQILQTVAAGWTDLNSFMFTHNWWHLAVFEIAEGELQTALDIYDQRCWGVQPDYSQDQIGAVSLLARLECAGIDVGDRWKSLKPYLETRADDVVQPFLSLQYLYGLCRSQSNQADVLLALIKQQATEPVVVQDAELWQTVGIPAAEGVVAHARGDYQGAIECLTKVRGRLWRIGGSHAQRDLFNLLLLDATLRAEQWQLAHDLLQQRRQWEPENPLLANRFTEVSLRIN